MDLLLDTHAIIWFLTGDERISDHAKLAIEDVSSSKFVSIASIWEIAIKISLDKLQIRNGIMHLLTLIEKNGFEILPVLTEHALVVSTLEFIHRDPFDRLLIAQCLSDNLVLITKDVNIKKYNIQTIW
ncbi:MAG: type II toxin-antitoxin system VapC family toxin [Bacteroidetes bacterium]|nr:type II toxin-antitoxin system VapC family toxin [Bacteroidota bacterium]